MRIARNTLLADTFKFMLQLSDTLLKLMINLVLFNELLRLARNGSLGADNLFCEPVYKPLLRMSDACLSVQYLLVELLNIAGDSSYAFTIKSENVVLVDHSGGN